MTAKAGIPVKTVFVRNRTKKPCIFIYPKPKYSLGNAETVRIYGHRYQQSHF